MMVGFALAAVGLDTVTGTLRDPARQALQGFDFPWR
jgi:TctA family transporter